MKFQTGKLKCKQKPEKNKSNKDFSVQTENRQRFLPRIMQIDDLMAIFTWISENDDDNENEDELSNDYSPKKSSSLPVVHHSRVNYL